MNQNVVTYAYDEVDADDFIVLESLSDDAYDKADSIGSLYETTQTILVRFLMQKLPRDMAEDIAHDVWLTLLKYVNEGRVRSDVKGLLWGIAFRKRAFWASQLKTERLRAPLSLDTDSVSYLVKTESLESWLSEEAFRQLSNERLIFLLRVPFIRNLFSSAEQVFWLLHEVILLEPQQIGKWTGKSTDNVYATLHRAKKKLQAYLHANDWVMPKEWLRESQENNRNLLQIPWYDRNTVVPSVDEYLASLANLSFENHTPVLRWNDINTSEAIIRGYVNMIMRDRNLQSGVVLTTRPTSYLTQGIQTMNTFRGIFSAY